jgi:hypothetical protein
VAQLTPVPVLGVDKSASDRDIRKAYRKGAVLATLCLLVVFTPQPQPRSSITRTRAPLRTRPRHLHE